ncbi:hypothetical protein DU428_04330 [Oceanihabitans sediminis]|uniref:Uncharacterized protein n=1 Tax=Oceanihabitans sediminis TaxID=1812012 RepID=A0A368PBK9_9FLAO|nr:hypothetical protein DU428_04330 [Oceanihabitans sediminis]
MPRLIFRLRSKTSKSRSGDAEDGLAQRFAIRMIRLLSSFQVNENPPRLFWLLFWSMQKSNINNRNSPVIPAKAGIHFKTNK